MPGRLRRTVVGLPDAGRPQVMGVVNVTPDSFSDGGQWFEPDAATEHGLDLVRDGADLLDVGGESTRPGAERPSEAEELNRVLPVVAALAKSGATVSIDTMRSGVAARALDAGALVVNDVSGGLADPRMLDVVRESRVPYICMHWRGPSVTMQSRATYGDVVSDVVDELRRRLDAITRSGIDPETVILDPGIGFAKLASHNWQLLRRWDELDALGRPMLVGASRKAFLGALLEAPDGTPRPAAERDTASAAVALLLSPHQVWGLRVHNVRATCDALRVSARWDAEEPSWTG